MWFWPKSVFHHNRHQLSIVALNCWCEGPTAFCRQSQLKAGITVTCWIRGKVVFQLPVFIFAVCRRAVQFCWGTAGNWLVVVQYTTYTLQICSSIFTCLINTYNANHSLRAAQIYCELSVGIPLSICYHRLTCINVSLGSCFLATDRIQLSVFISVDVWLQYFMQHSISLNINFIQLPHCCLLFWHYKQKWLL